MLQSLSKKSYRRIKRNYSSTATYYKSLCQSIKNKNLFQDVKYYCMFIGYPRSGHSLIGSLLDAHHHAVIAHELDALKYIQKGYSRNQIFSLLIETSRQYTESGRIGLGHAREVRYSYEVPNQWQGKFEKLKIIGDKKGGSSSSSFRSDPKLLQNLQQTIQVPIKFIHVIRNPYDNISSIYQRRKPLGWSLLDSINYYFSLCEDIDFFKQNFNDVDIIDIRHEETVKNPDISLKELCSFLDLDYTDDYLNDCASIVFKSPKKTRDELKWETENINLVQKNIQRFSFLNNYDYHD